MKSVATLILNRNLPEVTDRLVDRINANDGDLTDIFVIESGSDENKLSKHKTWWADWDSAKRDGLRFSRGINFGLVKMLEEKIFDKYEYFFLLTNDSEFDAGPVLAPLVEQMEKNTYIGILSPCSKNWGERELFLDKTTKYVWYLHNNVLLMRRQYIESLICKDDLNFHDLLFDGSNFRGYSAELELVAKGYANEWASAITNVVWAEKNHDYLKENSDTIKTDSYEKSFNDCIEEGRRWLRKKYGFNSKWSMQQYSKFMYDSFFELHPELTDYRV